MGLMGNEQLFIVILLQNSLIYLLNFSFSKRIKNKLFKQTAAWYLSVNYDICFLVIYDSFYLDLLKYELRHNFNKEKGEYSHSLVDCFFFSTSYRYRTTRASGCCCSSKGFLNKSEFLPSNLYSHYTKKEHFTYFK